jgi:two-component system cell cycle sensor histidine kinase/response regulator CckA
MYLPWVESSESLPASSSLPQGTETILLVEDDPALREMAATILRRLGYRVFIAGDGVEALTLANQPDIGPVDLLFTDVVMPNMNGKELADRIRILFSNTKILFTSAHTEGAITHHGVLDPGVDLLQKPFTPSVLAGKVREVLDAGKPAK